MRTLLMPVWRFLPAAVTLIFTPLRGQSVTWPEARFVEVPGVGALDFPVAVRHAGDGSGRMFILERRGKIKVLSNGVLTTFLDISDRVQSSTSNGDEQGLLGLAFPPGFGVGKSHFYVYYTTRISPNGGDQVLSRFFLSPTVPPTGPINTANPASEEVLLRLDDPFGNHNGGDLHFGPDQYLYLGTGDGGSGDDPGNRSQNPNDLWGKMLRLDVESTLGTAAKYAVPITNPFVGQFGVRAEIWHLGLRNPWRWSFDRETGEMWIGDVGQDTYEEIDYAAPGTSGLNFGWRRFEGLHVRPGEPALSTDPNATRITLGTLTAPVTESPQSGGDFSVTGGFVYRGERFTRMKGVYVFADYGSKRLYGLQRSGNTWARQTLVENTALRITSFGEDEDGELYLTHLQTSGANSGRLYQVGDITDALYLLVRRFTQDPVTRRVSFQFGAAVGKKYQPEASADLVTWTPLGSVITASNWTMAFAETTDPPAGSGPRYLRVKEL